MPSALTQMEDAPKFKCYREARPPLLTLFLWQKLVNLAVCRILTDTLLLPLLHCKYDKGAQRHYCGWCCMIALLGSVRFILALLIMVLISAQSTKVPSKPTQTHPSNRGKNFTLLPTVPIPPPPKGILLGIQVALTKLFQLLHCNLLQVSHF